MNQDDYRKFFAAWFYEEMEIASRRIHAHIDYAKPGADMTVGVWTRMDPGGKIVVKAIKATDYFAPAEPATPPATPSVEKPKNVDFFPSKIGRIDVLPRYPGVWG